jgi:hypothetical protein
MSDPLLLLEAQRTKLLQEFLSLGDLRIRLETVPVTQPCAAGYSGWLGVAPSGVQSESGTSSGLPPTGSNRRYRSPKAVSELGIPTTDESAAIFSQC